MRIGGIIYLIIGVAVAATKGYLGDIGSIGDFINLLLAIVLWPLVLLGVKFNLRLGGGGSKDRNDAIQAQALLLFGPALTYARSAFRRVIRSEPQRPADGRNS